MLYHHIGFSLKCVFNILRDFERLDQADLGRPGVPTRGLISPQEGGEEGGGGEEGEFSNVYQFESKACFPLGEFVRANREKSNLIDWQQTLTTSPTNHICFLLVRANKIANWVLNIS